MTTAPQDKAEVVPSEDLDTAAAAATASVPEGIRARFAGRTAVGLVREHNEDNLVVADLAGDTVCPRDQVCEAQVSDRGVLFAVCDGMGGAAAGEVASQMAVNILFEAMRRGGAPANRDDLARRLVSAVEESGKRIFDEAQKERSRRGMGTTATAAVLIDKVLFLAEVGDSRAYLLRGDTMKQLTKDQSLVNQLIEAGHLTEEEAEAFEHSNIILQALGTSDSVQVDLTFVELRQGDRLMLCSDGLSGLVHDDTIAETLRDVTDPVACASTLIEYAEAGGGHDNITVIVADFDGDGLVAPKESDTFGYLQYPLPLADGDGRAFVEDETTAGGVAARGTIGEIDFVGVDGKREDGTAMLWLVGGVVALLIGASVLALSAGHHGEPESQQAATTERTPAPMAPQGEGQAEGQPEGPAAANQPPAAGKVDVRVHTDVQDAQLLVNGEAHGQLSAGTVHAMSLAPGAYRFEAQTEGNPAAVAVVTVREGVPLDVHLNLPSGADPQAPEDQGTDESDPAADEPGEGVQDGSEAVGAPRGATEPEPSVAERQARREARRKKRAAQQKVEEPAAKAPPEGTGARAVEAAPSGKVPPAAPKAAPIAPKSAPEAPATPATPPVVPDNPF